MISTCAAVKSHHKRGGGGLKKCADKSTCSTAAQGGRRWRNVSGGRKSSVKEKKTHVPLMQNVNSPLPAADLTGTGTCPRERGPLISPETRFVLLAFSSRVTCQSGERATLKWEGSTCGDVRRPAAETSLFKWCIFHADGRVSPAHGRGFGMRAGAAIIESL